ncbi:hypothetical protein F0562_020199 [Nyssa sinensis]|uniref:Uncharacterized protein n=1 Tax=Nyssa sinensis TaxID=561372 RepID=A0A5J5BQZ4_9ASTE|nr:hypothetical protein F0562_020199 [Nyssa sinensis]
MFVSEMPPDIFSKPKSSVSSTALPNSPQQSLFSEEAMKMIKAVKKLKFWSRKKKKKNHFIEHPHPPQPPPPPPCYFHCHCSCPPFQPSAPPLPSWLDYENTHDSISAAEVGPVSGDQAQFHSQEIVPDLTSLYPTLPVSTSYQQYMVPDPVYGMPVAPAIKRERAGGFFGCIINIGVNLIRCFCPCFRVREAY